MAKGDSISLYIQLHVFIKAVKISFYNVDAPQRQRGHVAVVCSSWPQLLHPPLFPGGLLVWPPLSPGVVAYRNSRFLPSLEREMVGGRVTPSGKTSSSRGSRMPGPLYIVWMFSTKYTGAEL